MGLDKVGIVSAEDVFPERVRLRQWIRRGYHGEMGWLARDLVNALIPGNSSHSSLVVAIALKYYTPQQHSDNPATGKVSRYAWADDYHEVLATMLAKY